MPTQAISHAELGALCMSACRLSRPAGNHVRVMGDQASERFEKKWQMSAIEYHWEAHVKQCQLEDAVRWVGLGWAKPGESGWHASCRPPLPACAAVLGRMGAQCTWGNGVSVLHTVWQQAGGGGCRLYMVERLRMNMRLSGCPGSPSESDGARERCRSQHSIAPSKWRAVRVCFCLTPCPAAAPHIVARRPAGSGGREQVSARQAAGSDGRAAGTHAQGESGHCREGEGKAGTAEGKGKGVGGPALRPVAWPGGALLVCPS